MPTVECGDRSKGSFSYDARQAGCQDAWGTGQGSEHSVCLCQRTLFRDCPKRMRGHEIWEENGFISGSGDSGIARSNAVQETSKKLLPKKTSLLWSL